jgi:D-glycero-alpha-D-manno-heptose-7-phosphate kinase
MHSIDPGIEIVSVADIPGGTGLGSSSSFSVALINALYAFRGAFVPKEGLANQACALEIDRLGEPIGKQDQYAAAFGGINLIEFERHGGVTVHPVLLPQSTIAELESNLMLFYTGTQRDAREVLASQVVALESDDVIVSRMQQMVALAYEMRDILMAGDLDGFGSALHRGWEMKRSLSQQISTSTIDDLYARARRAGALGGKLAGAGGGGFLLLYCPKSKRANVMTALSGLQNIPFHFDWGGARIAFAQ